MKNTLAGLLFLSLLLPAIAQARWLQARTANFIVYGEQSEARLRQIAADLDNYDRVLRILTANQQPPSPLPLRVYLLDSNAALRKILPVGEHTAGFYACGNEGCAAFAGAAASGPRDAVSGIEIIQHEYAHHFMLQYYSFPYPAWYVEGFAEYMMTIRRNNEFLEVGRFNYNRASALLEEGLMPVARLLNWPKDANEDQIGLFYAQSWLLVHYLYSSETLKAAMSRYFQLRLQGQDEAGAFQQAFGYEHRQLDKDLQRYLRGNINVLQLKLPASTQPAAVTVTALPESADALLLEEAALRHGQFDQAAAEQRLKRLSKIRDAHPDDVYVQRILALAQLRAQQIEAAQASLDALLKTAPEDAELLYWRGLAEMEPPRQLQEERRMQLLAALPWLSRAIKLERGDYRSWYSFAIALQAKDSLSPDLVVQAMLNAYELAPQQPQNGLGAAEMLIRAQRYPEARRILQLLAAQPHRPESAQQAQRSLAALAQREAAVAPATP